jgi:hypothetical protein
VAVVVAILVGAFVVSRSCGTDDIKLTQDEAVATATAEADFDPEDTQVRLLRQGIDRHPFWIVSLSTLAPNGEEYAHLAVARVDATTGELVEFREQEDAKRGADEAP